MTEHLPKQLVQPHVHAASCGCGCTLSEVTDFSFRLPDVTLSAQKSKHLRATADFCRYQNLYFFRSLLSIPLPDGPHPAFCFGVWVRCTRKTMERVHALWNDEKSYVGMRADGWLANSLYPWVPDALDVRVGVAALKQTERPTIVYADHATITDGILSGWSRGKHEKVSRKCLAMQQMR